ncbi:MAG: hypothetical protein K6C36_02945 [Clostridia bacterium]|nr:hypothetical protein [Clostridia bacterium]
MEFTQIINVICADDICADIFIQELSRRSGVKVVRTEANTGGNAPYISFELSDRLSGETFELAEAENGLVIRAARRRGLIYGAGMFLRRCTYAEDAVTFDAFGRFAPEKHIRGHQLGYRPLPNTYDAWSKEQFYTYTYELMFSFLNTVEHMPYVDGKSNRNELMKYDELDLLEEASRQAMKLDIDLSIWYPNGDEPDYEGHEKVFSMLPKLDAVFVPGGDPGELEPDELFARCRRFSEMLKQYHPKADLWPSAQAPHDRPDWGEGFLREIGSTPECFGGAILGPNRAMDLPELRQRLDPTLPIRFYPDITHNLRCEHPVHTDGDEWHFAWAAALSRESCNPRPAEFRRLHEKVSPYCVGSVSYSEGVHDDLNKFVWADADFFGDAFPLEQSLEDYAGLFLYKNDRKEAAKRINELEENWRKAPDEVDNAASQVEYWEKTAALYADARDWRARLFLFKALCDAFVVYRYAYEKRLCSRIRRLCLEGNFDRAYDESLTPPDAAIGKTREKIELTAKYLFDAIGLQTSVEKYHAYGWERGAVLDTLENPLSDLPILVKLIETFRSGSAADKALAEKLLRLQATRYDAPEGGFYFSFALCGLRSAGIKQTGDYYLDVQGDRPGVNNGTLPVGLFTVYDHFSFEMNAECAGDSDMILSATFKKIRAEGSELKVSVNGQVIYQGGLFGGEQNGDYERFMLPQGFVSIDYPVKKEYIKNGKAHISLSENTCGLRLCELRLSKGRFCV